jgi:hypothetical protein
MGPFFLGQPGRRMGMRIARHTGYSLTQHGNRFARDH